MSKEERLSPTTDHLDRGTSLLKSELKNSDHVPTGHQPHASDETTLSRAMNRKLDFFVLPFLSILYLFSALDRGNVVSFFQARVSQKVFRIVPR